jgi:hypothetical protein
VVKVRILDNSDDRLSRYDVGSVVDMLPKLAARWSVRGKVSLASDDDDKPQRKRRAPRKKRTTDQPSDSS